MTGRADSSEFMRPVCFVREMAQPRSGGISLAHGASRIAATDLQLIVGERVKSPTTELSGWEEGKRSEPPLSRFHYSVNGE